MQSLRKCRPFDLSSGVAGRLRVQAFDEPVDLRDLKLDHPDVETEVFGGEKSFIKTIKAELIWRRTWEPRRQAETAIFQYINGFYNPRHRHSALEGKSPSAFERQVA